LWLLLGLGLRLRLRRHRYTGRGNCRKPGDRDDPDHTASPHAHSILSPFFDAVDIGTTGLRVQPASGLIVIPLVMLRA
jgi:hypothetical protein